MTVSGTEGALVGLVIVVTEGALIGVSGITWLSLIRDEMRRAIPVIFNNFIFCLKINLNNGMKFMITEGRTIPELSFEVFCDDCLDLWWSLSS